MKMSHFAVRAGSAFVLLASVILSAPALAAGQIQAIDRAPSVQYTAADEQGRFVYLVTFAEAGLLEQFRQQRTTGERFSVRSSAMQSAKAALQAEQQQHIQRLGAQLGRSLEVSHHYLATHSGIATRLTRDEAARLAKTAGVISVERERLYEPDTFRGPEFINADTLWDGSAEPDSNELLGEQMVAAILDTGIVPGHPSFANDTTYCSHGVGGTPDKLLSYLDCATTDGSGMCNGPSPTDGHSHGSHVAGTVAGNFLDGSASPAPITDISGVAPCAHVRSYKVCPSSCPGAQIQAGMNSVLLHEDVDVMNFSISGGTAPWTDNDRRKLDLVDAGIFVAASAGNTSTSIPDPFGNVGHLGPWVFTVANSSHDGLIANPLDVAGGPSDVPALQGTGPSMGSSYSGQLRWAGDVNPGNVEGCSAFAANSFSGEAALISRGTCDFAVKINHAVNAGANFVVVYNNQAGAPIVMGGAESTTVPSVMVSLADGDDIIAALDGGTAAVTIGLDQSVYTFAEIGDILSGGSLIGPSRVPYQHLQKPDITAPGTNILAPGTGASGYTFMSGTSMSSPHAAGAALLVHQSRPDWSPVEVKSALMMTASQQGQKPGASGPWDADDVGSGRVDLSRAAQAGMVMHETFANFLAANPNTGGDLRTLNLPALRNRDCSPDCTFTRTVRNTLTDPTNWTVSVEGLAGIYSVDISPASFAFTGDTSETQTVTITLAPIGDQTSAINFGQVVFTEAGELSPDLHYTVALQGAEALPPEASVDPGSFNFLLEENGSNSATLTIANLGDADLIYTIDQAEPAAVVLDMASQPTLGERDGQNEPIWMQVDSYDGAISGVGVGGASFLWFNRFTPEPYMLPFTLMEAGVIWPSGFFGNEPGDVFDLYVWTSPDGDPTSGNAVFQTSLTGLTLPADPTWTSYALPSGGVEITAETGDIIIGLVNRTQRAGTNAAAGDSGIPSQGRSWVAFNFPGGVVGNPPQIHEAENLGTIDSFGLPRNWIIRGFGLGGSACLDPSDVSWLTVTPDAGTIASGDYEEISIEVDMTGLGTGTFEARLCLETNDVNLPTMVIPITVEVVEEIQLPLADVSPASFDFTVNFQSTDQDDLTVANLGDGDLLWDLFEPFDLPILPFGDTVHLNEDFSDTTFPPAGWNRYKLSGAGTQAWERVTAQFNSAPASAHRRWSDSGDGFQDDWLVTPQMGFGDAPELSFIDAGQWMGDYGYTGVWASTGSCNPADGDFVEVAEINDTPGSGSTVTWRAQPLSLDLSAFSHQSTCLAFRYSGTFAHSLWIDDVVVTSEPLACYDPSEVPWLSVSATGGAVDSGSPADVVTVGVDGNGLDTGLYETNLCVHTNDPTNALILVPVSLNVEAPAGFATLEGTVTSLGYCSDNPAAAAGANIEIIGQLDTYNVVADGDGFYELLIDTNESPVSITASVSGHLSENETGVALISQETTVVDFDLVLEAACATVDPGSLSASLEPGQSSVQMVEIGNTQGAADLEWTIFAEAVNSRAHFPAVPYRAAPGNSEGISLMADESAAEGDSIAGSGIPAGMAVPAFTTTGFTADGYVSLDATVPGTLNLINATQPTNIYAATFINNDFSQQYMLASDGGSVPVNSFGVTDTATGAFTNLGTVTGGGAGSWSSMKWDHGTGTLFAVNATGGNNVLYTIDIDTLVATEVGVITGPGVDPGVIVIAIAISPDGLMYGIDIIADVLLAIDKNTAEASVIGPLGVNANFAQDMDFNHSDGTLYWAGYLGGGNSQMFTVDLDTGAATSIGNVEGGNELLSFSIAVEGAGGACQAPSAVPWLSIDPMSGTTGAGQTDMVEVVLDSTGLASGVYEAFVCVETSDANNDQVAIPVTLSVIADTLFQDRFEQ